MSEQLEQNKETARRFVRGVGECQLPDALFADDFSAWSGLSGDIAGSAFRGRISALSEVFPNGIAFEFFEAIAEGNWVALRCSSTATLFDGTAYSNDYHFLFEFDDAGRISKMREFMNVQTAAEIIRPAFAELARRKAAAAQ